MVVNDGRVVEQGTHQELLVRSAVYRTLLSGIEEDLAKAAGDRIEALAALAIRTEGDGTTASAWRAAAPDANGANSAMQAIAAPSLGAGLGGGGGHGGGGGGGGWRLNLAPTPELLV